MMTKVMVERALITELDDHLRYDMHENSSNPNSRNGTTSKTLRTESGQFHADTSRDREVTFEPKLVKKSQPRLPPWTTKYYFCTPKA